MKVYKGTDKNMQCRAMQYKLGQKETAEDAIRCGDKGLHSCEVPMDVWRYYPPVNGNRYFEGEADGKIDRTGADDSKLASTELTINAEIGILGIVKAQIAYTRSKAQTGTTGGDRSNLAGGDRSNLAGGAGSNLAGGYSSNLAGGYRSNLAGGDWSNLAGGENSLIVGGDCSIARGGIGSVIVLVNRDDNGNIVDWAAAPVDGKRIKADTYYKLHDGELVPVEEE